MSGTYQHFVALGRLGKDPVARATKKGTKILTFSLAVDDGYGEKAGTFWCDCVVWGKQAETLENVRLRKGQALLVTGRWRTEKWEKDGQQHRKSVLNVSSFTLMGKREADEPDGEYRDAAPLNEDEIPF